MENLLDLPPLVEIHIETIPFQKDSDLVLVKSSDLRKLESNINSVIKLSNSLEAQNKLLLCNQKELLRYVTKLENESNVKFKTFADAIGEINND